MKKVMVVLMLVAAGCGTPDNKLNSDPNNTTGNNTTGNNMMSADPCTFDADCSDGEACEAQLCVGTCVTAADCGSGEECGPGVNTTLNVCKAGSANNITANNISTNNNTTSTGPLYYVVRIQSTTSGAEGCDVLDPGPDIFGVGLEDSTGAKLGFGSVDWEEIQLDGNDQTDTSILDANGPDLASDSCPDMFDGNVVSLGCEATSWIAVSFSDGDGLPVALDATAGQYIRVYEWGGQCTTGSNGDTYDVDICTDTMGIRSGDDSSCTIQILIDAAGEASAEVAGF